MEAVAWPPMGDFMRKLLYLLFIAILAAAPVHAQQADHPWEKDQVLIREVIAGVERNGILALQPRLEDLEHALAGAPHAFEVAAKGEGDTTYVLTDGGTDALGALVGAAAAADRTGEKGNTVAVENPYLAIAFYMGSYYNEVGQHADSERVLAAGLALPQSFGLGQIRPMLLIERGAALAQLKRPGESLASYDEALKNPMVDDLTRAYVLRGRGSALIDLGRLDDAEASFKDSLKLAPDSKVAKNELQYIANLRAGQAPNTGAMTKVQPNQ